MNLTSENRPPVAFTTPPAPAAKRQEGWFVLIIAGLALLGGGTILYRFNPTQHSFYPHCQLYTLTGLQCPTCGGLRAMHALLHGHVAEAFQLNSLFVLSLPTAVVIGARWFVRKRRDPAARFTVPMRWVWIGLAVFIIFGIVRNLPGMPAAWGGS
jgi:hypothetical protein